MTLAKLTGFFEVYLTDPGGWSAYELADAIERSEAPMDRVHQALAPIGGVDAVPHGKVDGMTPLMAMCLVGYDASTVARLLEFADPHRVEIDPSSGQRITAMGYAARHHRWALVELLEQQGVDPAWPCVAGWNVLHRATMAGELPVIERLLDQGLDPLAPGDHGFSALDLALQATEPSHEAVVLALLNRLPDLSGWASPHGWPWKDGGRATAPVLRALVARGVPVNARSSEGRCVLPNRLRQVSQRFRPSSSTWPAERAALGALVELGADVNVRDHLGQNALGYAIGIDEVNLELLTLLVDAGADLDAPVMLGQERTVRDQLLLNVGRAEVVQALLERHDLRRLAEACAPSRPERARPRL